MSETANPDILGLICTASETPSSKILDELLLKLSSFEASYLSSLKNELDLLFDAWGDSIEKDQLKANFTLKVAVLDGLPELPSLKNALVLTARSLCLSPDFLTKSQAVKLSGARDSIPLKEVVERIKKLSFLKRKDFCIYLLNNNEWVKIVFFDSILNSVELVGVFTSFRKKITLDILIADSVFFDFDENELRKYLDRILEISYSEWSSFLSSTALSSLLKEQIRLISLNTFVPFKKMTSTEFTSWVNAVNDRKTNQLRQLKHPSEARGLIELKTLAEDFAKSKNKIHFSSEHTSKIREIILKTGNFSEKESIFTVFEIFSIIFETAADEESLLNLIIPFRDFINEIQAEIESLKYELFSNFDKFSLPRLKRIFFALKECKGVDFIAGLALDMPIKLLSALSDEIVDEKIILETYKKQNAKANADLILWAWRNKNNNLITNTLITPDSVFTALSDKLEIKYRQNSIKELKKKLLSDDKFISELALHSINNSPEHFLHLIDEDHVLLPSEKQSLIVKLARVNGEFKKVIESIHNAGGIKLSKVLSNRSKDVSQIVTSIKSHKAKILELEDIVQRQMPENSAAIAHARSYGDLRENAEFSAAKERQKFLRRRKFEIERELNTVSAIRFTKNDEDEQSIKPGREVILRNLSNNENIKYFLLGAWDGDPEKSRISSEAKLGKILVGKRQGDIINFDDTNFEIVKVSYLPDELLKELNDEN